MKGKIKETAGKLVDDKQLEIEGKVQHTGAKAKDKLAEKLPD